MHIAILGATSQIAKDLVLSFAAQGGHELTLFARRPEVVSEWLARVGLSGRFGVANFDGFSDDIAFDAVLNFVGVGNPAQMAAIGSSIFDITLHYDSLVLNYMTRHPECRYLFMSSGAAYGANFDRPADSDTKATFSINHFSPKDWYAVAKFHAECRHRSLCSLPIIDLRIFNCFSRTQDMSARFLITDIVRCILDETILKTSSEYIVRDFLHPSDFYRLVDALLSSRPENTSVDCYSRAPVDKPSLLAAMQREFDLRYEVTDSVPVINATGHKPFYYSLNTRAAGFGYRPALTSLDGVLKETRAFLRHGKSRYFE